MIILVVPSCYASDYGHSAFLLKLSNDTYNYLLDADKGNGLPENWYDYFGWGDYCSPEEAGFYMLSHVGAAEDGLISNNTAKRRIEETLNTLRDLPQNQSFYYRYYNTKSLVPTNDTELPSIGNAMLAASLMTVEMWADENNFNGISDNCSEIVEMMDFAIFYNSSSNLFYHDLSKSNSWDYYSSDGRLLSFVAYAVGDITESEFRNNLRNFIQPSLYYNATNDTTKESASGPNDILVSKTSWDGSMFTYIVPALFIKEHETSYQDESINPAVYAQMVYANRSCFRLNGKTVWGISDAYEADGDYCSEYCGAPPTAAHKLDKDNNPYQVCPGLVTPHASALALVSDYSNNATENLITLSQQTGLYDSAYGFKDSINVNTGIVTNRVVTLDQEWIFLALMNKSNGTLWKYFYQKPGVIAAHDVMYPTVSQSSDYTV